MTIAQRRSATAPGIKFDAKTWEQIDNIAMPMITLGILLVIWQGLTILQLNDSGST